MLGLPILLFKMFIIHSLFFYNQIHSTLHGIHMKLPSSYCYKLENFFIWKNLDYGIFLWTSQSVQLKNMVSGHQQRQIP